MHLGSRDVRGGRRADLARPRGAGQRARRRHHEPQPQGRARRRRGVRAADRRPRHALLGIDRRVEHEASLAAAAVGVGPEVVAYIEPEGYLVTRFIEGESSPPSGCASRRDSPGRASLRPFHKGPPLPGALRRVPDRRGVPLDGVRPWGRRAGGVRSRPPDRAGDRACPRAGAGAALPQRPAQRELHRRRHTHPDRRLGVRGDGRHLLRPRQLRRQSRAGAEARAGCCSRTSASCATPTAVRSR